MLKMTHLSKVYRTEVVETYALRDFNIDVKEGEFVAVTGPSGSGKTTFLTIAGLLETFSGGEYHLDGIAKKTPIRVGASSIDKVEILDGLKEGDRIVISGTDSFKGAAKVAISN